MPINMPNFKFFFVLFFFLVLYFLYFVFPFSVWAKNIAYIPDKETIYGLYVESAKNITIDGNIDGEAYLVGQDVTINGNIVGDVIIVAVNTFINGHISGNARVFSVHTNLNSRIDNNLTLISKESFLSKKASVGGNMLTISDELQFTGVIYGESKIISRFFFVDGILGKKANIVSKNLNIGKLAVFNSDLIYKTKSPISNINNHVKGKIRYEKADNFLQFNLVGKKTEVYKNILNVLNFLSVFILGTIMAFLFPKNFTIISQTVIEKPLANFIVGLLFYFISPVVILLLIFSIIGIPIALLLTFFMAVFIFLSRIIISLAIGNMIFKDKNSKFIPLLVGLTITQIIFFLPFINVLFKIITLFLTTGALFISRFGRSLK